MEEMEMGVQSLGQEDPLGEEIATHSRILAWKTPQTEEPGKLQSMGSQRVGHDWTTEYAQVLESAEVSTFCGNRSKANSTPEIIQELVAPLGMMHQVKRGSGLFFGSIKGDAVNHCIRSTYAGIRKS